MKFRIILFFVIVLLIVCLFQNEYTSPFITTVMINLDRSYMRRISTSTQLYLNRVNFERHSAVDGLNYIFTEDEILLFSELKRDNEKKLKPQKLKNVMSCALSHIQVWKQYSNQGPILIMEDDICIYPKYKYNISSALSTIQTIDPEWDIIWVSGGDPGNREVVAEFNSHTIYRMNPPEYIGQGTVAYMISEKGVRHFLRVLKEKGCFAGIDIFLLKTLDVKHAYGIHKPLVTSGLFSSTI
jgi:GR25 family glycosyltransferase involved in LPS biosynthesis